MCSVDRILSALEKSLSYRFRDPRLLTTALTHRSFANEQGMGENYERLELLGDAVLGLLTVEWLLETHPERSEGELAQLKGQLVSRSTLAAHARSLELGAALKLGVGEERSGGRGKASLLEDTLEAVYGAVWLDGGVEAARSVVRPLLVTAMEARERLDRADTKTRFQELVQARGLPLPEYEVTAEEGPDHQKRFTVSCTLEGEVVGVGSGRSKKTAEQAAAAAALQELGDRLADGTAP